MISHLFICSPRGDVIAIKQYRDDIPGNIPELFFDLIKDSRDSIQPVIDAGGYSFLWMKKNGLYFVCTTKFNTSPSLVFEMINRFTVLLKDYCGVLNEESLRLNFVLVYELLDEVLDFGYIQGTSTELLKTYIYNQAIEIPTEQSIFDSLDRVVSFEPKKRIQSSVASAKPLALVGPVAKDRKNEVYIDLLERLTVLIGVTGELIRSEINGVIQVKSYLSGTAEICMGLNEDLVVGRPDRYAPVYSSIILDYCSFHESVLLSNFEDHKQLSIQAPDGEFIAMNYRITADATSACILKLYTLFEEIDNRYLHLTLRLNSTLPAAYHACNIIATIPMPNSTSAVSFEIGGSMQTAEFKTSKKVVIWHMKRLDSGGEQAIKIKMNIPEMNKSTKKEIGPMGVEFEVPSYLASRLEIRNLKVFDPRRALQPQRWVRNVTHSDSYVFRIAPN
ncbi:AP-4 complex subunit mu-like [Oopsacas minuta]|uniref:AP-4 complex subunit mu-like n=1 Tax=Oopsacas minuta TaxID=111878 RepID=A0AAV7KM67_9METZ|nr:AP-4 complex subunit mu-like [Oopsacas minuta]